MNASSRHAIVVGTGIGLIGLMGCATTANYQNRVRSWEGQDAAVLIKSWGPPDATEHVGTGNHVLVYARLHHEPYAFNEVSTKVASRDPGAIGPPQPGTIYLKCATYFEVAPTNRIFSVKYVGDQCHWKD
jgi:hypothetical protein